MSETKQNNKLTVFLDQIGRTILGEDISDDSTPDVISIKNPVILHVVPDNSGRMSVQLLPVFFREFLSSKDDAIVFEYKKSNVTMSNLDVLDFRLTAQYNQLFGTGNVFVPPEGGVVTPETPKSGNVVNLFDE